MEWTSVLVYFPLPEGPLRYRLPLSHPAFCAAATPPLSPQPVVSRATLRLPLGLLPVMAASPPPRRVPVAITCWEGTDPYPTDQPLVSGGGIVTFASDFLGGFDATGPHGGLPRGVEADVAWLRAWPLPAEVYYGAGIGPLLPFTCVAPAPQGSTPTAAQVVADLHKTDFAAGAPGVNLDTDSPEWRRPPWDATGVDQVHTDEEHNYLFCSAEDLAEDMDDPIAPLSEEEMARAQAVKEESNQAYVSCVLSFAAGSMVGASAARCPAHAAAHARRVEGLQERRDPPDKRVGPPLKRPGCDIPPPRPPLSMIDTDCGRSRPTCWAAASFSPSSTPKRRCGRTGPKEGVGGRGGV